MSTNENQAIVSRIWEEIWNQGRLEVVDEIFSANYIGHIPATAGVQGPEAFKQLVSTYRAAFPDVYLTVEDTIAAGDKVVVRWLSRGTHQGEFAGISPTGNRIEVMGISIFLLVDGRITEEWEGFDTMNLMQQLGAVPAATG